MAEYRLMTHASHSLKKMHQELKELQQKKGLGLAVFDLDSTLFDVTPRLEKILLDYAQVPEHQKQFPEQVQYFKNIRILKKDWGIREILVRAGLDGHHHEFQESVREFWVQNFFSNEALEHDIPYAGAVEFVRSIASSEVEIAYLTGRDVHRMGEGSEKILRKWGFPLDSEKQKLVLKPHKSLDDAEFKRDWFVSLPESKYQRIWFFENEPVNIHLIRQTRPEVEIFYFDSTHSRRADPPEDLPRLLHFLLEEEKKEE